MTWTGNPRTSTTRWKKLRLTILQRDRHTCQMCGKPGADTVDHIVPWSLGGTDHPSNLRAVHDVPCHRAKTAAEATQARAVKAASRYRTPQPHPGIAKGWGGTPKPPTAPPRSG